MVTDRIVVEVASGAGDGVGVGLDGAGANLAKPSGFEGEATGEVCGDIVGGETVSGVARAAVGSSTGAGGEATRTGESAVGVIAGEGDYR